jgi:hypothetical protein
VIGHAESAASVIYDNQGAACHGGQGIVGLFPRLAGAPLVQQDQATSLIRVVLEGSRAIATAGAPTGPATPSFDWKLSDDDIAALLTYIRNAWAMPPAALSWAMSPRCEPRCIAKRNDRRNTLRCQERSALRDQRNEDSNGADDAVGVNHNGPRARRQHAVGASNRTSTARAQSDRYDVRRQ